MDEYDLAIVVGDQQGDLEEACNISQEQVCATGAVGYAGGREIGRQWRSDAVGSGRVRGTVWLKRVGEIAGQRPRVREY